MNLTGKSIYRPEEHGGVGISMVNMKPEAKPRWPKVAYEISRTVPGDHWYRPLLAAWDRLCEKAPETPRA